jgi:hypothetical protein
MKFHSVDLMPDEYEALLEIIRLSLRVQIAESDYVFSMSNWYLSNPRMCVRMLEVLNPKRWIPFQAFDEARACSIQSVCPELSLKAQ